MIFTWVNDDVVNITLWGGHVWKAVKCHLAYSISKVMGMCQVTDLPVELLACSVSCTLCWACDIMVRSLILSWFMLWMQASAEEADLFWCKVLCGVDVSWWDKWAVGLKVALPCCPLHLDLISLTFPSHLPALLGESTLLCETCGYLVWFAWLFDCFWLMLHAALLCWTLWMPGFDCKAEMGCSYSTAVLEFLECERLKGKGLVHGFSFLALPCRKATSVGN